MRITTANAYDASIATLQRRQQGLTEAQEQLTSGRRVLRASDDPAAAAQAERALATLTRSQAQQRALDASRFAMEFTESTLAQAGELLQQAREKVLAAGNGSYTDQERRILGETIRTLRSDLLAMANRSDGAGRFLFGGQAADGPPFVETPTGVTYNAAAGELQAASGSASPLSMDGAAAWLQAPDPANPGGTLSLFDVMERIASELLTPGRTSAQVATTVADGVRDLDVVSTNLGAWRSRSGEALNRIDAIGERLSRNELDAQRERSDAIDLDMLQAISDFQNRQTGYDAALKTYSIVQRMSLFDYLR